MTHDPGISYIGAPSGSHACFRESVSFFLLSLLFWGCASGSIPRDESFTVESAGAKIARDFPGASPVVPAVPPGVVLHEDLVYASISSRKLHLDIYEPKEVATRLPAILFEIAPAKEVHFSLDSTVQFHILE